MAIEVLNHCTVLTDAAMRERTVRCCSEAPQLHAGPCPPLSFPGFRLYSNEQPRVRGSGGGSRAKLTPGVRNHIASSASDRPATLRAVKAHRLERGCRRPPTADVGQLLFNDPNGARVQLDFLVQEQSSP